MGLFRCVVIAVCRRWHSRADIFPSPSWLPRLFLSPFNRNETPALSSGEGAIATFLHTLACTPSILSSWPS